MVLSLRWQHLLFYFIFLQLHLDHVQLTWPMSNVSKVHLLGLFQGDFSWSDSKSNSAHYLALFKAAVILSQRYNITVDGQPIGWHVEQTKGDLVDTWRSTCLAITTLTVVGIVGPRLSREAHTIATFAGKIGIPVVSYTATDPNLSSRINYPAFYRTVPSDTSAALAIARLFQRYKWRSCVVIYQNDAYGYSGMRVIVETFTKYDLKVTEMIKFDIFTNTFDDSLKDRLDRSRTRIVVLWAIAALTPTILQHALDQDAMGPSFLWILSSSPSLEQFNGESAHKFIGTLTVEPVTGDLLNAPINASLRNAAYELWRQYESESFPGEQSVDKYALFAFDATWLLIQSLHRWCAMVPTGTSSSCLSITDSTNCFDRYLVNASALFDQITSTTFLGVTGPIEYGNNETNRINGIYYLVQNSQLSLEKLHFIPVLQYTENESWKQYATASTIVWPDSSEAIPTDSITVSGASLNILIIPSVPFLKLETTVNASGYNQTKLNGYAVNLIDLLKEKLHFIPNLSVAPYNVTYREYIQTVIDGKYDLLIGDVTITSERRKIVAFSSSIFDDSLSVIIRKPDSLDVDLFSYVRPFSIRLWLAILGATIYASLLIYILERENNAALRDRPTLSAAMMSIWYSVGTMMGYGVDFHVTTAPGRILTVALYMLSLVLVATYTANLASNLTMAKPRPIINGIEDLKKGKLAFNRIGIINGTSMAEFFVREVSQGRTNFYLAKNRQEILDALSDEKIDATIFDTGVAEYVTNYQYCNLTIIDSGFNYGDHGIVMSKTWPYAQELDSAILSLRESGQLDNLRKTWFGARRCVDSDENINAAMQLESMAGLFLTFAIVTVLSLLISGWRNRSFAKNYVIGLKARRYTISPERQIPMQSPNQTPF